MSRNLKKILYGLLYFSLWGLIAFFIYLLFFKPASNCFDNKQNQNEEGIDCGGICSSSCELLSLTPLKVLSDINVFGLNNQKTFVLFQILNSNSDYGASFDYELDVLDKTKTLRERIKGNNFIYSGEKKYLLESTIKTEYQNIGDIKIKIENSSWKSPKVFSRPEVIISNISTNVAENSLEITGNLENKTNQILKNIGLLAILFDKFEKPFFASPTLISELVPQKKLKFIIPLPEKVDFSNVNSELTKVFLQ